ncbi:MAG TPA: transporter substrate-binding domain-containing protein [Jiangellales bacterium]|nr:transporter substrate-binding domain-containing protein [Jiangellales bacterium]
MSRSLRLVLVPAAAAIALAGCAPADEDTDTTATEETTAAESPREETEAAGGCTPDALSTLQPGTLTIATSEPAYEPWMVDNDPSNGQGFESAVAYAVAGQLGYAEDEVTWTRVPFDAAIQPGPKQFDFDINQFSITEERREAVDFSSPYYDVRQAVVAVEGNPAASATSIAELQEVRFGAQVGTTSLAAVEESVQPTTDPQVFNTNDDAKLALDNGQIDALVVDLPTAFFLTAAEIEGGVIVGQLPEVGGEVEQFGLVLDQDSPLTECVSEAVDALRDDGTLDDLEQEWLADVAGAPELS